MGRHRRKVCEVVASYPGIRSGPKQVKFVLDAGIVKDEYVHGVRGRPRRGGWVWDWCAARCRRASTASTRVTKRADGTLVTYSIR